MGDRRADGIGELPEPEGLLAEGPGGALEGADDDHGGGDTHVASADQHADPSHGRADRDEDDDAGEQAPQRSHRPEGAQGRPGDRGHE